MHRSRSIEAVIAYLRHCCGLVPGGFLCERIFPLTRAARRELDRELDRKYPSVTKYSQIDGTTKKFESKSPLLPWWTGGPTSMPRRHARIKTR